MAIEIVKVQRPIASNAADPPWLVYDKTRKHYETIPAGAIPESVKKALGSDAKGYFKGAWSSIVGWGLSERVGEQDW